jgi:RHS repeat-associated protein
VLLRHGYKFGLETSRTYSNGIAAAETYDADGRASGLVYTLTGKTLPNLGYTYDASGNRNLIRRNHYTTTSEAASYTPDNQLSTWGKGTASTSGTISAPTSSQSWTLDSRGNWSSWTQNGTAQARTHDGANELTAMGTTNLTWDAAGDLTSDGTLTYVWGPRGTLDTVKQGSTVKGFYGYDALGRRALKTVGSLKTISIFDGWQCVYQRVTGSGTDTTKAFTFGNYVDEPVTMIRKWGSSTDTAWYLQGGNYNIEALTDRTGTVEERYEYTPYGKPTVYTGVGTDGKWFTSDDVSSTTSAKGNNILFQGRELDAETGNDFFRARYYQPTLGRFASRDPLRLDGGDGNFYRFVMDAPFTLLDPIGLLVNKTKINPDVSDESVYGTCILAEGATGRGCLGGLGYDAFSISCSGGAFAVTVNADLRIYLLPVTDPRWGDGSEDKRYGLVNPTPQQRRNATRSHEQDHQSVMLAAYSKLLSQATAVDGKPCHCRTDADGIQERWSNEWQNAIDYSNKFDNPGWNSGGQYHKHQYQ